MSSSASRRKRRQGHAAHARGGSGDSSRDTGGDRGSPLTRTRRANLGAYVGFALIWAFVTFLLYLTAREIAWIASMAILCGFFLYVAWCAAMLYAGKRLAPWQQSLARGPLALTGGGRRSIESLQAASSARNAALLAFAVFLLLAAWTTWTAFEGLS